MKALPLLSLYSARNRHNAGDIELIGECRVAIADWFSESIETTTTIGLRSLS